jgi:integrator complex subunit 3
VAPSVTNGPADASKPPVGSLWIYSNTELLTQTIYTYLRIIADHAQAVALNQLRQRETEFCIQVLRERWNDCMQIGRDLVRLLQNVAKLNEFEQLWRDMINSPATLSGQFAQMGGLTHLMKQPTRRRCLISRLTIDMERKVCKKFYSMR